MNRIKVYAHRGFSAGYPENTLAAFRAAAAVHADGIELDVHMTKDGKIVVFHDYSLQRLSGQKGLIRDLPYEQLKTIDIGSWFGREFSAERIPLLTEVLETLPDTMHIIIEIKHGPEAGELFCDRLAAVINDSTRRHNITISSFMWGPLEILHQKQLPVKLAKTFSPKDLGKAIISRRSLSRLLSKYKIIDEIHPHYSLVHKRLMRFAREQGKTVVPWTVNTKPSIKRLRALGVDGIITNYPDKAVALLQDFR